MNDNMDVKTWKAYCELYEKIGKKIDQNIMQVFDNGIKCFSSYLCHANPEYVYSTTYLQQFNEEFWKFIEAFYEKYKIVDIYLSIYSLNSYVFEYDLLDANDRELYHSLQDKFDKKVINKVILKVRKRIEELLNKDEEFIEVKVYFKPKKMSKDGLEFRPLHTTDLITQIAIVAMLHLFVYEIPEKKDYKLLLSNLSRLIPSDFYGNRVSTKPECLFKSWKKQYQKYNQNSNDALKKYHTSLEYKYEVTLDLENFFPTINPIIIYHYIVKNLPAHLKKEDMNLMKRLLRKLLFCKLVTQLDEKMLKQYYKAFKSQTNNVSGR